VTDRFDDEEYERAEAAAQQEARKGKLLVVRVDGETSVVECSYEGIREGLSGMTFDFVQGQTLGCYVPDEGLLTGEVLNVPMSILFGRPLYGTAVVCAAQPDDFGNTLSPTREDVAFLVELADAWGRVVANAALIGQEVYVTANLDTLPPPKVVAMDEEQFARWIEHGEMPT
jgi:hypothetical protein